MVGFCYDIDPYVLVINYLSEPRHRSLVKRFPVILPVFRSMHATLDREEKRYGRDRTGNSEGSGRGVAILLRKQLK
jgi:hypothetical protein